MSVFHSPLFLNILDQFDDSKQIIHAIERKTFSFGYQEPGENERALAERAIDQETRIAAISNLTYPKIEAKEGGGRTTYEYLPLPTVASIFGVARATTKLNSHCVAAAIAMFKLRSCTVGISLT